MTAITIRDLHTPEESRRVAELEQEIWEMADLADVVPPGVITVTTRCGGLLLGAFDETNRMIGFSYSVLGQREGRLMQWSHMTGVVREYRSAGIGYQLKVAQRERCLGRGIELVEWTFDPLQAMNAHFNFVKLGIVSREYEENIYGESSSLLHRGTPTDRLVAQWWLNAPRVRERIERGPYEATRLAAAPAPLVVLAAGTGPISEPDVPQLNADGRMLAIEIPPDITTIVQRAPEVARAWRARTREVFNHYLERRYVVSDFTVERREGAVARACYVLTTQS